LQKADLAAAPMYATSQRANFVDFTTTFIDVYATILLRRTTSHPTINAVEVSSTTNSLSVTDRLVTCPEAPELLQAATMQRV